MLIKSRHSWEIRESDLTPEHVFWNRRRFLRTGGLIAAGAVAGSMVSCGEDTTDNAAAATPGADPSASLYPVQRNAAYTLDRPLTDESVASVWNNFYEFGSHKLIAEEAQNLIIRPWEIKIDGKVEKPFAIEIDDLLAKMPLEERLYRHRCVEAWSMAVPWSGFPLKSLVELAKPLSAAKYVRMETFLDSGMASGQKAFWYPWPYVEGVTMAEATNDLAFLVTGVYGKPLAKQFGAPLRLALPWKYGFKSIKSIVRITFDDSRPKTFWEDITPDEYGFWANVNPEVPHPRWSQATEEVLGTGERVPTQLFNGYGDAVAGLYQGLESEPLYM